jgi:hypothetical protein
MDNINDILSGLTDEDFENLRAAADSIFGSSEEEKSEAPHNGKSAFVFRQKLP